MIFTHPEYRKRGLVRRQLQRLHQLVEAGGYDIVILWGIPFYYRQFGYCYCVEGLATESLPSWRVEAAAPAAPAAIRLRAAGPADIPLLARLYPGSVTGLDVHLQRSEAHWRYLLESAGDGRALGYSIQVRNKRTAHVFESSLPDQEAAPALLELLKKDCDEILVNWPASGTLAALARGLGSIPGRSTQWAFRLPSLSRFLNKIAPLLERRLADSAFHRLTTDFVLNLFTEACLLRIADGRIAEVNPLGFVDTSMGAEGGTLNIPPDAWMRLLFGDRSLGELYESWPDIVVKPKDRALVQTLFPRMEAYLYTPYHYYGPEIYSLEEKYLGFYL